MNISKGWVIKEILMFPLDVSSLKKKNAYTEALACRTAGITNLLLVKKDLQ